jgi:hypothetical protein
MIPLQQFIGHLKEVAENSPDPRTGNNTQYSLVDIVLSAFAVFLLQCPSWLDFQRKMDVDGGISNLQSLFGIINIPTDNHIRHILDNIDNNIFNSVFYKIIDYFKESKSFELFTVFENRHLIAVDGTDYFNSTKIHCPNCSTKYHKKEDSKEYHHTVTGIVLCSINTSEVITFPPFFVSPQENNNGKQDTECKSFKRSLDMFYDKVSDLNPIFLADAIYGNQPMIKEIQKYDNCNFIITCKVGSQKNIFDYVNGANLDIITHIKRDGSKKLMQEYRYMTDIPLINDKNSILVNYIELKETELLTEDQIIRKNDKLSNTSKNKKYEPKVSIFTYITDLTPTNDNIQTLIKCGRTRWRVENGFNSLKKRGYHFEHNFGHGKNKLSYVLITLLLLAFLMNTVSLLCCDLYISVRNKAGSFHRFITRVSILTEFLIFDSFESLLKFMYKAYYKEEYIDTS